MRQGDFTTPLVGAAAREIGFIAGMVLLLAAHFPAAAFAQDGTDRVTGFARDPVHVAA
jgi:allantoinase